jgi:hypothetical protein
MSATVASVVAGVTLIFTPNASSHTPEIDEQPSSSYARISERKT